MFPDRNRQPGPGFQPPNGRRMQQPSIPFRQPPQIPHPYQQMQRPMAPNRPQVPQGSQGFRGPQRQEMPPAKKEGLLSKILGKSKQKNASPNRFAPAASTTKSSSRSSGGSGILETLKNPDSLNNMLNNTQKVLQAAEQFTPMVEQYGPVIKNLPSVWKVFRNISSAGETEDQKAPVESVANVEAQKNDEVKMDSKEEAKAKEDKRITQVRTKTKRERTSGPKLYI
ncbi:VrrA/YqfQ family protein [Peribacillus simplex]|uniref:VrrA/YqfQ family protein n=1 Tax=Peribacillus simplex TaxID=1478 RepID=UPI003D2AA706